MNVFPMMSILSSRVLYLVCMWRLTFQASVREESEKGAEVAIRDFEQQRMRERLHVQEAVFFTCMHYSILTRHLVA